MIRNEALKKKIGLNDVVDLYFVGVVYGFF